MGGKSGCLQGAEWGSAGVKAKWMWLGMMLGRLWMLLTPGPQHVMLGSVTLEKAMADVVGIRLGGGVTNGVLGRR
jgi:hypothetical protein